MYCPVLYLRYGASKRSRGHYVCGSLQHGRRRKTVNKICCVRQYIKYFLPSFVERDVAPW